MQTVLVYILMQSSAVIHKLTTINILSSYLEGAYMASEKRLAFNMKYS